MSATPRRRIIRPAPQPSNSHHQQDRQNQKLRARLEKERTALNRWMARLRRAFHSVEKIQRRVFRIEKQIASLEE
jgi:septal ring factor EnvC (AmiA/AmiB activator)